MQFIIYLKIKYTFHVFSNLVQYKVLKLMELMRTSKLKYNLLCSTNKQSK